MKIIYTCFFTCLLLCFRMSGSAQCATYAYLSNGGNCISLSWFPQSIVPATLPLTISFNGSEYTLSNGLGDIGFPAVYKKSPDDCALPSDFLNGDLTINYEPGSISCQYPGAILLALHEVALQAISSQQETLIKWEVKNDGTVDHYQLDRSKNGQQFSTVYSVAAKSSDGFSFYQFLDAKSTTVTYYRLKVVDKDGSTWYSKVVHTGSLNGMQLLAYPNPGKGVFTIEGISPTAISNLQIYDVSGRSVSFKNMGLVGQQSVKIQINTTNKGIFYLKYNEGSETRQTKLLVQ